MSLKDRREKLFNLRFRRNELDKFKKHCQGEGATMSHKMRRLMQDYIIKKDEQEAAKDSKEP